MDCENSPLMHIHHIIPRYMGGTNDPTNLVEVTVTQHAMFHFCNYQLWGNAEDYVAYRGLSGLVNEEEFLAERQKTFGKMGAAKFKEILKTNPQLKEEIRLKLSKKWTRKGVEASKTPEARERQKQRFKENGHQQGEKNSQYGKIWIYNLEKRESKRIGDNEIIPDGWKVGRIVDFDAYFERQKKNEEKKEKVKKEKERIRKEKVKFYTEWYQIYQQTNFIKFCEITGYSKSQQNLCDKFKKYVDEYTPKVNNGK